jgi:hypothetical protein
MPFVPAENTVRVAVDYISTYGERATNVQHFRNTEDPPTLVNMAALATQLEAWYENEWAPVASDDWQTDVITITSLAVEDGLQYSRAFTVNGEAAAPSLPAQDTLAMSTRTGFTGRSRRGRMYHVGLAESFVEGSTVNSTAYAALLAAYNALYVDIGVGEWQWVVASFVEDGGPRSTALVTPITSVILVDPIVDSMDTRKPRNA